MGAEAPDLPVMPYQLPDGAIVSLLELAPRERVRASPEITMKRGPDIPLVRTRTSILSAAAAIDLGFAGVVSITASADSTFMLRETQVIYETVSRTGDDSIIKTEFYGVAIRTGIAAWGLKFTGTIGFDEFVAQCTLNIAQSAMQIQGVGLGILALPPMFPNFGAVSASLSAAVFQSLGLIEQTFWDYLVENHVRLTPVLLGVDLKASFLDGVWKASPSANYGLFGVYQTETCNEVQPGGTYYKPDTGYKLDEARIASIYGAIVGPDTNTRPTAANKVTARRSLFNGDND